MAKTDSWKKLKAALGEGFDVGERPENQPELDIRPDRQMPELDIRPDRQMPEMDLTKTLDMPAMDLRPGAVEGGSVDVSDKELENAALEQWVNQSHGSAFESDNPLDKARRPVRPYEAPPIAMLPNPEPDTRRAPVDAGDETVRAPIPPEELAAFHAEKNPLVAAQEARAGQLSPKVASRPFSGWKQAPGSPEDIADRERRPRQSPATGTAKQLVAKARARRPGEPMIAPDRLTADINSVGPAEGPSFADAGLQPPTPAPEGLAGRPGSVPAQVGQAVAGASPMPQQGAGAQDDALAQAQARARDAEREARYAAGMGRAADIISGTRYNDRAGEDIRAAGQQGVEDVLAQEAQGQRRANEGRAVEDQGFQRAGEGRAQGADARAQTTFEEAQALNDPNSRQTKAIRATGVALYPKIVAKIPPDQFNQMSGNDLKVLFGELPVTGPKGPGGPKAYTPAQLMAISKRLPLETLNVYSTTKRINNLAEQGGGWEKIGGVAFAGGLIPGLGLDKRQQAFRQEIGNLTATFLKAGGGKNITSGEERILIGNIGADPLSPKITPEMLQRGMEIIERAQAGNVRQSMALVPPEIQSQLFQSIGLPQEWVQQDLSRPTGQNTAGPRMMVNPRTGEEFEVE